MSVNISNTTFYIKENPSIHHDKRFVFNFSSGGINFTEMDMYYDTDTHHYTIYYLNLQNSVLAYETGAGWEIEYRYITFGNNVNIEEVDLAILKNAFSQYIANPLSVGSKKVVQNIVNKKNVLKIYNGTKFVWEYEEPTPPEEYFLTFKSPSSFTLNVVDNQKFWDGTLEYSTDKTNWNTWDGTTTLSSGSNNKLYLRGTGNTYITGSGASETTKHWVLTGSNIEIIGNIENLLDYATVEQSNHPVMATYCYAYMFYGCTGLTTIPSNLLPATTLTNYCYYHMFDNTNIVKTPQLLATTLANNCYQYMFNGCTKLAIISQNSLPATTLKINCYHSMFYGCTSLTSVPTNLLPATTVAGALMPLSVYSYMFKNCTSLTNAPNLPATTVGKSCYIGMFEGCSSLIEPPIMSGTTRLKGDVSPIYSRMFKDCTSLRKLPSLLVNNLGRLSCESMFEGCINIKLSETQTDEYQTPYRIPDVSSTSTDATKNMFTGTGGTFTGTPTGGTIYYTSNEVI